MIRIKPFFLATPLRRLSCALALSSLLALVLLFIRIARLNTLEHGYLIPNYMLGLVPILFTWWLKKSLKARPVKSWFWRLRDWLLFALWLLFVPNSFYLITDFIHLGETSGATSYDVIMLSSFAINGFIIGFLTLLYMHEVLRLRFGRRRSHWLVAVILFAVSFALYLGRDVRLNSWDILVNPIGLLVGLSDVFKPSEWGKSLGNTLLYFSLLAPLYLVVCALVEMASSQSKK